MNLKAPLLETAQELFATLTRINPQLEVRKRYDILRSLLNIAVEQQLTDVTIKLSGLYDKIDYLIKKHQISQNDRSLSFAINDARVRLSDLTATTDEELQKAWSQDLKAIAQFISLIYDAPIPAQLPVHFSIHQFFQHHFSFGSALRNTAYFCLQDIGIKVGSVLLQFQSVNIILIFHASSALMNIGSHLPVTLV